MDQMALSAACRQTYEDTGKIYEQNRINLGKLDFGFSILYSPPLLNPPILFIGDQPGGGSESYDTPSKWPDRSVYATEGWPLARNLRSMFGVELLDKCVGINVNFFRSPNAETWKTVQASTRQILEQFSRIQLLKLIEAINPCQIVVVGISTLDKFGPTMPLLYGSKNHILMKSGSIAHWPAISTLHLSGAQIASVDRFAIAGAIKLRIGASSQDFEAFDRIMRREGGVPPGPDDQI